MWNVPKIKHLLHNITQLKLLASMLSLHKSSPGSIRTFTYKFVKGQKLHSNLHQLYYIYINTNKKEMQNI